MTSVRGDDCRAHLDAARAVRGRSEEREDVGAIGNARHPRAVVSQCFDQLELLAHIIGSGTLVRDDHPPPHGGGRYQEG